MRDHTEIEWREAPAADPTARTLDALDHSIDSLESQLTTRAEIRQREHASLQELIETRLADTEELTTERVGAIRREIAIHEAYRKELKADSETHRLELKSDGEKTLTTATIAAEKAVQAALAAAEKARDQQTIASQLATAIAQETSKEQLKQQGETFTTGIAGLSVGYSDVKTAISELRAEQRGVAAQIITNRNSTTDFKPMTDAITALVHAQSQNAGKQAQVIESRASNQQLIAIIGLLLVIASVVMPLITR